MLYLAAAIHNLQESIAELIQDTPGLKYHGIVRTGEGALNQSRLQLAESLKILVKDTLDG